MLETMLYYLLFIYTFYLYKLDVSRNNILLNSQNNNTETKYKLVDIQSAENCKGFSETTRQLPDKEDYKFWNWFAGIIDGDGYFDIRLNPINKEKYLKQIRIKLHNRDIRILRRIQNYLHLGKIRSDINKPYSIYILSIEKDMRYIIKNLNGLLRLKVSCFKQACFLSKIDYKKPNYNIGLYDPYFAGLIDAAGSIMFNYANNRLECGLEFKYNEYTSKLNFNNTLFKGAPCVKIKDKNLKKKNKNFKSIIFNFQSVDNILFIYDYFMHNRLYCDMKFYRVSKIKPFMEIRKYKNSPKNSVEYKIYYDFLIDLLKYDNPLWYKIPCIKKYLLYRHT